LYAPSAARDVMFITFRVYRQKLSRGAQKTAPPRRVARALARYGFAYYTNPHIE
jgi:hypothetical protein